MTVLLTLSKKVKGGNHVYFCLELFVPGVLLMLAVLGFATFLFLSANSSAAVIPPLEDLSPPYNRSKMSTYVIE